MARTRVERLLDTYFNRPMKEYRLVVDSLSKTGGLDSEEISLLKTRVPDVHADTIIRHVASRCEEKAGKRSADGKCS